MDIIDNYILDDYFEWLYYKVINFNKRRKRFRRLIRQLHSMDYYYSIEYDNNRASDGKSLRWYYVEDGGDDRIQQWDNECTVLEMLIALAIKMENIMDDPIIDNSAAHWFWMFMYNLDLDDMDDSVFDLCYVIRRVKMFLDRTYDFYGRGNIIYIPDSMDDLRTVEVWYQMCWYLSSIM